MNSFGKFLSISIYVIVFCLCVCEPTYSHIHSEASYQYAWAEKNNAVCEYHNDDGTRVDCLTDTHAIEFDFANKWAESVGQALYYQYKTGKRAKIILILENPQKEIIYFNRVMALSKIYDFDVDYVTPSILDLKENGKCYNPKCRCNKCNN